ncbi:MAG: hypothetical protein Hens3KO_01400 [Henriciella sp.]
MSFYRILPLAITGLIVSACSESFSVDEQTKTRIDCFSSKTVMTIANRVHEGTQAGIDPNILSGIRIEEIDDSLAILKAAGINGEAATYFEFETARRLNAMQDALRAREPETLAFQVDTDAYKIMTETQEMAETCQFEVE